jgi:hypothetical protein
VVAYRVGRQRRWFPDAAVEVRLRLAFRLGRRFLGLDPVYGSKERGVAFVLLLPVGHSSSSLASAELGSGRGGLDERSASVTILTQWS